MPKKSTKPPKVHKLFPTPADCEAAYYDAFDRADLNLMMAVWADEAFVVCIHPNGPRLAGLSAIRESFSEIFSGGTTAKIDVGELRKEENQTLAIHSVYESFRLPREAPPDMAAPTVLATNVFHLTAHGWRMIMHHASLAPEGTKAEEQGVARILH